MNNLFALASKAFGVVVGNWKLVLAAVAAILLSYNVGSCVGYGNGKRVMELALAKANERYLLQKSIADEAAANQRITDTIAVNRQEQELRNAIAQTPDSQPDAARIALGCQRLRAAGTNTAGIPACRGPSR